MQDFIQNIASQFNLSETQAKGATGGLLSLIKDHVDSATFTKLSQALPMITTLISTFQEQKTTTTSSTLGSLASFAGAMMGGKAKVLSQAFDLLQSFNLSAEQGKHFAQIFGTYLKDSAGNELFSELTDQFPEVKQLL
ncbi:MAG: DUF2780 domain-containing protein [Deltaproteobacteria bacterium]|nr:DUF2780 domain-containing protein [Deltaproteobacteria bacterium]